jgi:acyl carrier protein
MPHTPLEKKMCFIFEQILAVAPVGIDDSFFDLGGDSLLATKAIGKIRSEFDVDLAIREIFETPTVSSLVRKIEHSNGVAQAAKKYLVT